MLGLYRVIQGLGSLYGPRHVLLIDLEPKGKAVTALLCVP